MYEITDETIRKFIELQHEKLVVANEYRQVHGRINKLTSNEFRNKSTFWLKNIYHLATACSVFVNEKISA